MVHFQHPHQIICYQNVLNQIILDFCGTKRNSTTTSNKKNTQNIMNKHTGADFILAQNVDAVCQWQLWQVIAQKWNVPIINETLLYSITYCST